MNAEAPPVVYLPYSRCWRCDASGGLVNDPLMPPSDGIGVCPPCAGERYAIKTDYLAAGTHLPVNFAVERPA